jgi:hypothetical protein
MKSLALIFLLLNLALTSVYAGDQEKVSDEQKNCEKKFESMTSDFWDLMMVEFLALEKEGMEVSIKKPEFQTQAHIAMTFLSGRLNQNEEMIKFLITTFCKELNFQKNEIKLLLE